MLTLYIWPKLDRMENIYLQAAGRHWGLQLKDERGPIRSGQPGEMSHFKLPKVLFSLSHCNIGRIEEKNAKRLD
jgi:hypothetical protein